MKVNKYAALSITILMAGSLLCVSTTRRKAVHSSQGKEVLDRFISRENSKKENTVGRPIHYNWHEIFKIIDTQGIDPKTYRYTGGFDVDTGYTYENGASLMEIAASNIDVKAMRTLVEKYHVPLCEDGTCKRLLDAIINDHYDDSFHNALAFVFEKGVKPTKDAALRVVERGEVNDLKLCFKHGLRINWKNQDELFTTLFNADISASNHGTYNVEELLRHTNIPITMETFTKYTERAGWEYGHPWTGVIKAYINRHQRTSK